VYRQQATPSTSYKGTRTASNQYSLLPDGSRSDAFATDAKLRCGHALGSETGNTELNEHANSHGDRPTWTVHHIEYVVSFPAMLMWRREGQTAGEGASYGTGGFSPMIQLSRPHDCTGISPTIALVVQCDQITRRCSAAPRARPVTAWRREQPSGGSSHPAHGRRPARPHRRTGDWQSHRRYRP